MKVKFSYMSFQLDEFLLENFHLDKLTPPPAPRNTYLIGLEKIISSQQIDFVSTPGYK